MKDAGLAPVAYWTGMVALVCVIGALAWGSWRLRAALLPLWAPAPARLAEAVIGLTALVGIGQVLGAIGVLSRWPALVTLVAAGVALGLVGRRLDRRSGSPARTGARDVPVSPAAPAAPTEPAVRAHRTEVAVAVMATAVLTAQWVAHTAFALGHGMTHADTLWYHGPYAARFVQEARITELVDRADVIQAYFPLNSQLVHALVILPFGRDVLAPLVNLGWFALALLAAWCVGRRRGLGPLCVLGAVVVLGLPMLAGTHPGQASNDVVCAALLLAAVALLLERAPGFEPVPTGVAGLAAGLALGTKLTVAVPVVVLTVGVVVLALRARRLLGAALWCGGVALTSGFWFVRNWLVADNPLPWFELELGPLSLPAPAREEGASVVDRITDGSAWTDLFLPGLSQGLGRAWQLLLALALAAIVLAIARPIVPVVRVVGLAVVGGVAGYMVTPTSAELNFAFNLRYLAPVLLVALAVLPVVVDRFGAVVRGAVLVAVVMLVVVNAFSRHHERVAAWPRGSLLPGVIAGFAVVGVVLLAVGPGLPSLGRLAMPALVAALIGGAVGGWLVQAHYLDRRYVDAGLHIDPIYSRFRDVSGERIAVVGSVEVYPMFGLDLSNRVTQVKGKGDTRTDPCVRWRSIIGGTYGYVLLDRFGIVLPDRPPEEWFDDSGATEVLRSGESVVYRLDGPLRPRECV